MGRCEERGRFSRDDIERMVREAEANKAYDETVRQCGGDGLELGFRI